MYAKGYLEAFNFHTVYKKKWWVKETEHTKSFESLPKMEERPFHSLYALQQ